MRRVLSVTFGSHRLKFPILDTPIADLWLNRMEERNQWSLDDPTRFYNFNDPAQEEHVAVGKIRDCISTINSYQPIIDREFVSVDDQDTLNYLHNIFELYHGMLDKQDSEFWKNAPQDVRLALANLNIAVHRCESLFSRQRRVVCTWFGQPKTHRLPIELQASYGKLNTDFGGVYLNYVEIGKTARDLMHDNDQYIADEMFKPFDFYSSDFVINFFQTTEKDVDPILASIDEYFEQHRSFFESHGVKSSRDTCMLPLKFKVAQLDYESGEKDAIIEMIRNNQIITSVEIN